MRDGCYSESSSRGKTLRPIRQACIGSERPPKAGQSATKDDNPFLVGMIVMSRPTLQPSIPVSVEIIFSFIITIERDLNFTLKIKSCINQQKCSPTPQQLDTSTNCRYFNIVHSIQFTQILYPDHVLFNIIQYDKNLPMTQMEFSRHRSPKSGHIATTGRTQTSPILALNLAVNVENKVLTASFTYSMESTMMSQSIIFLLGTRYGEASDIVEVLAANPRIA